MLPPIVALIVVLTVLLQIGVMFNVGRARGRHKVKAPATTGHPQFECAYRVQTNTIEATVMFLPALWIFSLYTSPLWAAILGAIWLLGRVIYAVSYMRAPEKRGLGFQIAAAPLVVLTVGGLIGVIRALIG